MAEAFYNKKCGYKAAISAGIKDVSKKYNGRPSAEVIQVMKEVGIDISHHKVEQYTSKMLDEAEQVVVFCNKKICPNAITIKDNVLYIEIPDPYKTSIGQFRIIRDKIRQTVECLE